LGGSVRLCVNPRSEFEFLGQRVSSDFCAVYSGAMLISLYGVATSRCDAHSLFGTRRRSWHPPSEFDLARVVGRAIGDDDLRPQTRLFDTAQALGTSLRRLLQRRPAVLIVAHCALTATPARARHAFLATHVTGEHIHVVDPLSAAPVGQAFGNARISLAHAMGQRWLEVEKAPWRLDMRRPLSLLAPTNPSTQGARSDLCHRRADYICA
jgi:hypothetical protein